MKMFRLIQVFLYTVAAVTTLSCSTKVSTHSHRVSSTNQLPLNKAGILIFRSQNDVNLNQNTVNIYIDGSYLTSLKKGEYQYADLCPGQHYIEFAYANADPAYLKKLNKNQTFELKYGDVFYTEVIGDNLGNVRMKPSSKGYVEKMLPNLHLQQRTISRVNSAHGC